MKYVWLTLLSVGFLSAGEIAPGLLSNTDGEGYVDAIVVMKEQVNLMKVKGLSYKEKAELLRQTARITQAPILRYLNSQGSKVKEVESFWVINAIHVKATPDIIEELAKLPDVDYIKPVQKYHIIEPVKSQKAPPSVNAVEWNIDKIKADSVWYQYGLSGSGVHVGVLDTGIDPNHPALDGNFSGHFLDAVNNQTDPYDDHGHGTHVSGTIAGGDGPGPFTDDIGVAYNTQISSCKAFSASGSGTDTDIFECSQWFVSLKADSGVPLVAISNSWGGGGGDTWMWDDIWNNWRGMDIIPVFAAGNSGPGSGTVGSPGDYPIVIAVGATDNADNVADFSSRGPAPNTAPYNDTTYWSRPDWNFIKPDISAPGAGIRSSVPGGGYDTWDGTSMATPHVTGVIALMFELNPTLDYYTVYDILTNYGVDQPSQGGTYPNNDYGWGRINALKVIQNTPTLTEPFIKPVAFIVDDGSGNNDGVADPGESVNLFVVLRNLGLDATNVSATLTVLDTGVTITDNASVYGTLVQGDTSSGDGFAFSVSPDRRPGLAARFEIHITADGGYEKYDTFALQLGTPTYYTWFQYDFTSEGPWTTNGTWALTTVDYNSPPSSFTDSPGGDYGNNEHNYLLHTIAFDLSDAYFARVIFHHKYDIESGYDFGYVQVSTDSSDAAAWTTIGTFSGTQSAWVAETLNIPADFMGQQIYVRFLLETDGSVTKDGWYVDDVLLQQDVPLSGVYLISLGYTVVDTFSGDNANGNLDPGETAILKWLIANNGSDAAINVQSTLSTTSSYLTITSSSYNAGDILSGEVDTLYFEVQADAATPHGTLADLQLVLAGDNVDDTVSAEILIGKIFWTSGVGPYIAYDITDVAYTPSAPDFQWMEIDTIGTAVSLGDDDRIAVALPFTFRFYGVDYDTLWINSNGWLAFGPDPGDNDFSEDPIPDTTQPNIMIAAYWDDLNPSNGGQILYYYDSTSNVFIVEYREVPHYGSTSDLENFQVVLYDPAAYPTTTGDGLIKVQFLTAPAQGDFTLGLESITPDTTYYLAYVSQGSYNVGAETITDSFAILFLPEGTVSQNESNAVSRPNFLTMTPMVKKGALSIRLTIPAAMNVNLSIYNIAGRKVMDVVRDKLSAGIYSYDVRLPSTGIYIIRLDTPDKSIVKKAVFIR